MTGMFCRGARLVSGAIRGKRPFQEVILHGDRACLGVSNAGGLSMGKYSLYTVCISPLQKRQQGARVKLAEQLRILLAQTCLCQRRTPASLHNPRKLTQLRLSGIPRGPVSMGMWDLVGSETDTHQ